MILATFRHKGNYLFSTGRVQSLGRYHSPHPSLPPPSAPPRLLPLTTAVGQSGSRRADLTDGRAAARRTHRRPVRSHPPPPQDPIHPLPPPDIIRTDDPAIPRTRVGNMPLETRRGALAHNPSQQNTRGPTPVRPNVSLRPAAGAPKVKRERPFVLGERDAAGVESGVASDPGVFPLRAVRRRAANPNTQHTGFFPCDTKSRRRRAGASTRSHSSPPSPNSSRSISPCARTPSRTATGAPRRRDRKSVV